MRECAAFTLQSCEDGEIIKVRIGSGRGLRSVQRTPWLWFPPLGAHTHFPSSRRQIRMHTVGALEVERSRSTWTGLVEGTNASEEEHEITNHFIMYIVHSRSSWDQMFREEAQRVFKGMGSGDWVQIPTPTPCLVTLGISSPLSSFLSVKQGTRST